MFSDQLDEALNIFQQLAEGDPKDWQAQLYIAQIYGAKHDLANARAALNKAKALNGENLEIRYQEVKLLETENKNDEALAASSRSSRTPAGRSYSEAEARVALPLPRRVRHPLPQHGKMGTGRRGVPAARRAGRRLHHPRHNPEHRHLPAKKGLRHRPPRGAGRH